MEFGRNLFGNPFSKAGSKKKSQRAVPGEREIREFLVESIAATLRISPSEVKTECSFADYGLDSLQMVSLSTELEEFLHRKLSEVIAWDYPTIESLARYLSGGETQPAQLTEGLNAQWVP